MVEIGHPRYAKGVLAGRKSAYATVHNLVRHMRLNGTVDIANIEAALLKLYEGQKT